jgi:hypothetical protein
VSTYWVPLGAAPVTQPTVTYGTTPPASPNDGDRWIFPADSTNGVMWEFRFRAAAGTYPWEFVGGAPLSQQIATSESTATQNTWLDLTTDGPKITVPRAGDYHAQFASQCSHNAANSIIVTGPAIGTNPSAFYAHSIGNPTAGPAPSVSGRDQFLGVASGAVIRLRYYNATAGTANWSYRQIAVTPVRVS